MIKKAVTKNSIKMERSISGITFIRHILEIFNSDVESNSHIKEIKKMETETVTIDIIDLSSRLNINCVDFTLFKQPPLSSLLKEIYSWQSLQDFRDVNGFVGEVSIYKTFFKDEVNMEEIFTIYNIPNINNSSDLMLEKLFELRTEDENRAFVLRSQIVDSRKKGVIYDSSMFKRLMHGSDEVSEYINIIPNWNVNYVSEVLLKTVMFMEYRGKNINNYKNKYLEVLNRRESQNISIKDLERILKSKNRTVLTYLGDKTTFWEVHITDKEMGTSTKIIIGWDSEKYNIIFLEKIPL
jgi:hypothetical protein